MMEVMVRQTNIKHALIVMTVVEIVMMKLSGDDGSGGDDDLTQTDLWR